MKSKILALAIVLAISQAAHAGNLDKPVEHKITNRTEIARGAGAAADCFSKAEGSPAAYLSCQEDVLGAEERANTDSDGFGLGLEIGTVIDKGIFAKNHPDYRERSSYKIGLGQDREQIQKLEKQLGITNDEACAAAGKNMDVCRAATLGTP